MIIDAVIKGMEFKFETSDNVFSPRKVDAGTMAMLSCVEFHEGWKVLDLGCGYGAVGITAARFTDPADVYMVDIDPEAVSLSRANAARNGVENFFFFQAEDGIRDGRVTGVQTCALPILNILPWPKGL